MKTATEFGTQDEIAVKFNEFMLEMEIGDMSWAAALPPAPGEMPAGTFLKDE